MNKFLILMAAITLACFSFISGANEYPQGIKVRGKAEIIVEPDRFSLSFAIVKRGKSASKTKMLVDHKTNLVISAAKNIGINGENVQSARMNLRPIYQKNAVDYDAIEVKQNFNHDKKGRLHLQKSALDKATQPYIFEVSRQISIKLNNISDYDRLLDQIVKIGVTNISSLSMSVSKADELYQKALLKAVVVAKEKALKLAGQAGVQLGKLVYLQETSYNQPAVQSSMRMAFDIAESTHQSHVGTMPIRAEVLITFAVEP